ncbi:MAG UNVERIFIED_CONTAM: hypothetical protein LVR18_11880 [Planctomycetaceae bacterium]
MSGSVCNDCYQFSGIIGSHERSSPTHVAATEPAGTVPESGSLCNDCYRFWGSIGSDKCTSPTHVAATEPAGTVPVSR